LTEIFSTFENAPLMPNKQPASQAHLEAKDKRNKEFVKKVRDALSVL
jgi:hypothetical protein